MIVATTIGILMCGVSTGGNHGSFLPHFHTRLDDGRGQPQVFPMDK